MATICRLAIGRSETTRLRSRSEAEPLEPCRRDPRASAPGDRPERRAERRSKAMFSATVRFGNSDRSWKITWMPSAFALRRVERQHRRAVDLDLAGARRMHAGDDLDQRRLAGAVLADEAVHLAAANLDRRRQRLHAAVALGDAREARNGGIVGHAQSSRVRGRPRPPGDFARPAAGVAC